MKFLLLGYTPADAWDAATAETPSEEALAAFAAYQRFEAELRETGEFVSSEGLGHPAVTTTVRRSDAGVVATDGPFVELKEVLASFAVIDCESQERAVEIVSRMVDLMGEPMEIRPIMGDDFAA
ncbi:YCII-related protein [Beutenbergia cavernae DSM 12333]|uniref:YCII-related protein n=1 Tax=Beutenbergia cavernae (strain ATCC BAA-8 / DSM 12333 / CCUG 43141 / JCM 11478 / NBRC 16432 / NCIMB 13614 / HKI 0122) TaxID=471853 RepID=C5C610_BEUC1|nr:YciI family protein [Beutenbergia cavernae]ACQ82368.1 YCII-related protein [Beutenbergia cavernae DSM 12333]